MDFLESIINAAKDFLAKDFLFDLAGAIAIIIIGFWIAGRLTNIAKKAMKSRGFDESLTPFLSSLISVGLKVLVILSAAGVLGFETASFIAILGAMAFAIGMALQGSLGHFASGVMILIFKPYRVGDLIDAAGFVGVVDEIQIFSTILMTPDNKKIIVPNGSITGGPITNISGQGEIRVDMTMGIGYTDDIDKARTIIQEVADACPHIDHDKTVDIFVSELADSSVNFAVRPWAKSAHYWDVYFYMHENIKKAFDKNNIGIPYPQMDVHVHNA